MERASSDVRFALAKFRPTTLPGTMVARSALYDQLTAGAGKRLTVVVGSAGAGKSVLLSSWAAARQPAVTSWLSCDEADANPVRFWAGFIEAIRMVTPGFGADAADLLTANGVMSADVIASITNDADPVQMGRARRRDHPGRRDCPAVRLPALAVRDSQLATAQSWRQRATRHLRLAGD